MRLFYDNLKKSTLMYSTNIKHYLRVGSSYWDNKRLLTREVTKVEMNSNIPDKALAV